MRIRQVGKVVGVACIILSGCKHMDVREGRFDQEFVATAQEYEGDYLGEVKLDSEADESARSIEFNLSIEDREFVVRSSQDLLGQNCGSDIGTLQALDANDARGTWTAEFKMNLGRCRGQFQDATLILKARKTKSGHSRLDYHILKTKAQSQGRAGNRFPEKDIFLRGKAELKN